jgi:hypothetical protein
MFPSTENDRRRTRRTPLTRGILIAALLAAGAAVSACERGQPTDPERAAPDRPSLALNAACDPGLGGVTHTDSILATATWAAAGNPHRVDQLIHIEGAGSLRLTPGALVCFGGGGGLRADNGGRLRVLGSAAAPVVLTAADLADGWLGVRLAGTPASSSLIENLRLEHTRTEYALSTHDDHTAAIDSAVFRQNEFGVYLWGRESSLRRSHVDTVTSAASAAVTLGRTTTFQQTVIRGAAGVGLAVLGTDSVSVAGGRIEGSGGVGLRVTTPGSGFLTTQPVRVTGGATYPAQMEPDAFTRLYLLVTYQDSLLGNARDTLLITGGTLVTTVYAGPALPWRVTGDVAVRGQLMAGPGAALAFDSAVMIHAHDGGRVVARGTAAAPVRFTGTTVAGWSGMRLEDVSTYDTYLTNVRVENAEVGVYSFGHPVVIDSAVFRQNGAAAWLVYAPSRLSRTRIDTTFINFPAVMIGGGVTLESTLIRGAAGIGLRVVASNPPITSCEIRDGAGDGIELVAAVQVHDCNLVGNAGVGIRRSGGTAALNVENNWWGDAAGPFGPAGDGISGLLDYTPWRTTPYVLPYVP